MSDPTGDRPVPEMLLPRIGTRIRLLPPRGRTWMGGTYLGETVGGLWWSPDDGGGAILTPWRNVLEIDVEPRP